MARRVGVAAVADADGAATVAAVFVVLVRVADEFYFTSFSFYVFIVRIVCVRELAAYLYARVCVSHIS